MYGCESLYTYQYNTYSMAKRKKEEDKAVKKTITIMPEQEKYIDENYINLSHFVQGKIDEEMKKKR